jgi:CheY-like chemotaxis protein
LFGGFTQRFSGQHARYQHDLEILDWGISSAFGPYVLGRKPLHQIYLKSMLSMSETTPYRLLYIDDEPDNLLSFKAVFRRFYTVFTAPSAAEGLRVLQQETIDLIISDHRMPQLTGIAFFEQIRDQYPDVVRIILTGYSDVQSIVDAINKGKVYHYVTKPWKMDELKVMLDNALETYSLKRQNRQLELERNELLLRAVQQQKEQVQSQYEALRSQVNPHFLFNSLNTLSLLIATDTAKAISYTKQFAKVYRTLLEWGNQPLVSLRQELDLVNSFVFLHQMRFGENLQITIQIPDTHLNGSVPPFAVQLLVENAIKHNIIADEHPLRIQVSIAGQYLQVSNNLQPRGSVEDSTGTGLKNLRARYEHLCSQGIAINTEAGFFEVKIPLIAEG